MRDEDRSSSPMRMFSHQEPNAGGIIRDRSSVITRRYEAYHKFGTRIVGVLYQFTNRTTSCRVISADILQSDGELLHLSVVVSRCRRHVELIWGVVFVLFRWGIGEEPSEM